jgi:predicted ATPase
MNTHWVVITGPPSSGKTSLINKLQEKGYLICPEVAREIICYTLRSGFLRSHLPRDSLALQREILAVTLRREHLLSPDKMIFFDRGIPDSIAYFNYHHFEPQVAIRACSFRRYAHVFYCEGLPVIKDNIRLEDDNIAKEIGEFIIAAYESLGYQLIYLPAVSIHERLQMIMNYLHLE